MSSKLQMTMVLIVIFNNKEKRIIKKISEI